MRIRCPKCEWEPDGGPHWQCHCGCVWNTFQTAARCPSCGFQHAVTQCPPYAGGCNAFSPHLDWYEGLDESIEEILSEKNIPVETTSDAHQHQPVSCERTESL